MTDKRHVMQEVYGIIGYPLTHSFSPDYFMNKFRRENIHAVYKPFPLTTITAFSALLTDIPGLRGLNVTIPYKQKIMPLLTGLSPEAAAVGAVNCIGIAGQQAYGYNTDVLGFRESLKPLLYTQHNKALVLGTGGSARAVCFVLQQLGIDYTAVSRMKTSEAICYQELTATMVNSHPLIINTTPLGMFPEIHRFPDIPYQGLTRHHLLYDLIYNPAVTVFLQKGKAAGATVQYGLPMLHLQAEASWKLWAGGNHLEEGIPIV